jgi:hypothetical protein
MKTIYCFFAENDCTKFEQAKLIEKLAEIRYLKTLEMLKRVLR